MFLGQKAPWHTHTHTYTHIHTSIYYRNTCLFMCMCVFICVSVSLRNRDCMIRLSWYLHSTSHIVTPRYFFCFRKKLKFREKMTKNYQNWPDLMKIKPKSRNFKKWCCNCVHNDIHVFLGPKFTVEFVFRGYFEKHSRKSAFLRKNILFLSF